MTVHYLSVPCQNTVSVFLTCLTISEHLNVSLAKFCEKFTRLTDLGDHRSTVQTVKCKCNGAAKLNTVSKDGPNKGRQFYCCKNSKFKF